MSADSEDGQAGHVQDGPASVTHGAAREEAHPSRAESARNPSPAVADSTLGKPQLYTASSLYKEVCSFNMDDSIEYNWKLIVGAT